MTLPPHLWRTIAGAVFMGSITIMALAPLVLSSWDHEHALALAIFGLAAFLSGAGTLIFISILFGFGPRIFIDENGVHQVRIPWLQNRSWGWSDYGEYRTSIRYGRYGVKQRFLCAHHYWEDDATRDNGDQTKPNFQNAAAVIPIDFTSFGQSDALAEELAGLVNEWRRRYASQSQHSISKDNALTAIDQRHQKRLMREAGGFLAWIMLAPFAILAWLLLR